MADYTPEDVRQAERIVSGLVRDQAELPPLEGPLVVSDVEVDAAAFASDLEVLAMIGAGCPAARVEEDLVPVALSLLIGPVRSFLGRSPGLYRRWWHHPFIVDWLHDVLRFDQPSEFFNSELKTISHEHARASFSKRAVEFLATRIAAIRNRDSVGARWFGGTFAVLPQRRGGPRVSTPGCNFAVSTNSPGLRVFWSGAYRISPNYFSHPTTPTVGLLQAGTYVFGVDGGAYGNVVQWDISAVTSLPGHPHTHLNF